MTPATSALALAGIVAALSVPMERDPACSSSWVDRRGTKRKRHGKTARNRSAAKAARAVRKKARR